MNESTLLHRIRNRLNRTANVRAFRNNIGTFQDKEGRWISFGIPGPGGSDLVGWTSVVVTPEMVGRVVAVFTAIEAKAKRGVVGAKQETWMQAVQRAGGYSGIVRTVEEAEAVCGLGVEQ